MRDERKRKRFSAAYYDPREPGRRLRVCAPVCATTRQSGEDIESGALYYKYKDYMFVY